MKIITKTVPRNKLMLAVNNVYSMQNLKNLVSIEYESSVCPGCADIKYQEKEVIK